MGIGMMLLIFMVLLILNMPIAFALATAVTLYLFLSEAVPMILMVQQMFVGINKFVFLAIPFFILSGLIMQKGGISKRLVELSSALLDKLTGGFAMSASLASMVFASISGSGPATTAAIGGIVLPELEKRGYGKNWSVAFLASSGTIGPVIPPSISMVLFGVMASASIGALFIAGIIPGILMGLSLMIIAYFRAKKMGIKSEYHDFSWKFIFEKFKSSILALLMPVIIIGGILGGVFTPTEAAVVSVVYAFIVSTYIYRSLPIREYPVLLKEAASISGVILLLTANATAFAWLISSAKGAEQLIALMQSFTENQYVILLLMNVFLLIIGAFIDTASALLITVPTMVIFSQAFGIDPIHLGLIMVINLCIGMATPPLGITLFTACSMGKVSITHTVRPILPMIGAMLVVLLLVTYFPALFLWLPNLFFD